MAGPALPPIGERLRQARLQRGMTVRGLARAVDVSASLISQIETGKSSPSVSTLYAITAALDISIEDVFGDAATATLARERSTVADVRGRSGVPATMPAPSALVASRHRRGALRAPPAARRCLGAARRGRRPNGKLADDPGPTAAHSTSAAWGRWCRANEREVLHLDSGVTWELLGQLPDTHVDFLRITYAPGGQFVGSGCADAPLRHRVGARAGWPAHPDARLRQYVLNPGDSVSFDCSTPHSYANHGIEPAVGVWFVAERYR